MLTQNDAAIIVTLSAIAALDRRPKVLENNKSLFVQAGKDIM